MLLNLIGPVRSGLTSEYQGPRHPKSYARFSKLIGCRLLLILDFEKLLVNGGPGNVVLDGVAEGVDGGLDGRLVVGGPDGCFVVGLEDGVDDGGPDGCFVVGLEDGADDGFVDEGFNLVVVRVSLFRLGNVLAAVTPPAATVAASNAAAAAPFGIRGGARCPPNSGTLSPADPGSLPLRTVCISIDVPRGARCVTVPL